MTRSIESKSIRACFISSLEATVVFISLFLLYHDNLGDLVWYNGFMRDVELFRIQAAKKLSQTKTFHEQRLESILKEKKITFETQKLIKRYIVDFYFPDKKIVIELDGKQHKGSRKDLLRDSWLWRYGYRAYRFYNSDLEVKLPEILSLVS